MLKAYVDDSGSDGTGTPYFLAGFLMSSEHWEEFSDAWQLVCDQEPSIEYFKMTEAHSRTGQFARRALFKPDSRDNKVHSLLEVIETTQPVGVYSAVDWPEFRVSQKPFVSGSATDPYHCLVPWLLDSVMAWQKYEGIFPTPVDFIFDEQGEELAHAVRTVYPKVKDRVGEDVAEMMGGLPEMKDDKKVLPLQAADMLAGTLRKHFDPNRKNDGWEWLYKSLQPLCAEGSFGQTSAQGTEIFDAWQRAVSSL